MRGAVSASAASVTTREKAPTILTAEGARRLTARIRDALALADDLLVRAYEGRAWEALGHGSWEDYCAAELPELQHIKLRAPARRERSKVLYEAGATEREIAAATGASAATAHRDVLEVTGRSASNEASTPPAVNVPTHVLAAQAIGKCGLAGGTTLEVIGRLGWRQGPASVALSRAAKKGLVVATGERRHAEGSSPGFAVYVAR